MKISELFNPDKPGSVKIRRKCWNDPSEYFTPYFLNKHGAVFGLLNGCGECFTSDVSDWEIFVSLAPKKILYEIIAQAQTYRGELYHSYWKPESELEDTDIKTGRSIEI